MRRALGASLCALAVAAGSADANAPAAVEIEVLSNRADLISAGDALVAISVPSGADASRLRVRLGRRDVTAAFAQRPGGRLAGLVNGLRDGRNVLTARLPDGRGARILITNHPNGGPVFSGPQLQPWKCQETAVDTQCNQPPEYSFVYRSTDSAEKLQAYDPANPPSDVASTTTDEGVTVPFIVRVETGYQDRDQYQIATLYRPGEPWDRWQPQEQWNHKLLITHGGSCGVSYEAGTAPSVFYDGSAGEATGVPAVDNRYAQSPTVALGRGFAVLSTALDNNGHNCNLVTQAESLVMAKERLIEQYGDLRYTIGTGCSGGSLTQQWVANAYPGIYQGILPQCSFPDTWTSSTQVADYHLLRAYFEDRSKWGPGIAWTPDQMAAVEGHLSHVNAYTSDTGFFSAAEATYPCPGLSDGQRYHPERNPGGARCGIADHAVNVFGLRDPGVWSPQERQIGRSFAGVALDNVGVEYGLDALRRGLITPAQFVDLNARIGGLDVDARITPQRMTADQPALANAFRSGGINEANNMRDVAIIDLRGPDPGVAHDAYRTWAMRARLEREQGHFRNHVIWFGQFPAFGDLNYPTEALIAMDRWLGAVEQDRRDVPLARKIVDDRPADITDRCSQVPGVDLVGAVCRLDAAQTRYGTPRTVAGDAITTDKNKCELTPLDRSGHGSLAFSQDEWEQLQAAFASGVCDFSRPGVSQQDTIPWLTYQDVRGRVIYGGRPLGPAPVSESFGCLASRSPLRLGLSRGQVRRRLPEPVRTTRWAWRWCVRGRPGEVIAAFGARGRVALIATMRGGRLPIGRRLQRLAPGVYRDGRRLIVARRGRVRYVVVAAPSLIRDRTALLRALRRASL